MTTLRKRYVVIAFIFLIGVSAVLHLWRLSSPSQPVFDEVYFSTFAAQDALHEPYLDIHPPLGRFILSLPLFFYNAKSVGDANFVRIYRSTTSTQLVTEYKPTDYKNFPYVDLRLVSVFFGLVFLSAFFLFVREIAGNNVALLALFFAVLENALLLHTRLILMDGIYLALGFLGLYLFFRKKTAPVLGGLIWGLALSVKLSALVIAGPLLILWTITDGAERKDIGKRIIKFILAGAITLLLTWFLINTSLFPVAGREALFNDLFSTGASSSFWTPVQIFAKEVSVSVTGYLGEGTNWMMSPWYFWPLMMGVMRFNLSGSNIALIGNSFVWYLGTLAVIAAIIKFVRAGIKRIGVGEEVRPALLLLGGYILSLVPFFTVIRRATFLYHYFPALAFAIALAAFLIIKFIGNKSTKIKIAVLAPIIVLTIIGFIISAPYTYGL
ncbi:MAG: phospholipid carrier-dependent glycosyltransferase [Minisyncoccia bacterium]|jgi:dolichyl-phosphate-mannose--protein O-mannosyl transferase